MSGESAAKHEARPGASLPGSVVAEVGGDRGAAIVHVPADWHGKEIEIRALSEPWAGRHVAVLARRLGNSVDYSAFFPSLKSGEYLVRELRHLGELTDEALHGQEVRSVTVVAGRVLDTFWAG